MELCGVLRRLAAGRVLCFAREERLAAVLLAPLLLAAVLRAPLLLAALLLEALLLARPLAAGLLAAELLALDPFDDVLRAALVFAELRFAARLLL